MSEHNEAPIEAAPYYWETGSTEDFGWSTKVWHWTHWTGDKIFTGMEFGGEVVATFLGLTRSKYDWILETKERDEHEKLLRQLEKRQRKQLRLQELLEQEKKKLNELEHGSNTESEKPADILL